MTTEFVPISDCSAATQLSFSSCDHPATASPSSPIPCVRPRHTCSLPLVHRTFITSTSHLSCFSMLTCCFRMTMASLASWLAVVIALMTVLLIVPGSSATGLCELAASSGAPIYDLSSLEVLTNGSLSTLPLGYNTVQFNPCMANIPCGSAPPTGSDPLNPDLSIPIMTSACLSGRSGYFPLCTTVPQGQFVWAGLILPVGATFNCTNEFGTVTVSGLVTSALVMTPNST
jgi:hypothetical protein